MTLGFVVLQNHHHWREEDFEFARRFCRLLVVVCRFLLVACRLSLLQHLLLHVFEDRVCPSIAPDKTCLMFAGSSYLSDIGFPGSKCAYYCEAGGYYVPTNVSTGVSLCAA